jgi:hypothetical protein
VVKGLRVPWFSLLVHFAPVIAAFLVSRTHQNTNKITESYWVLQTPRGEPLEAPAVSYRSEQVGYPSGMAESIADTFRCCWRLLPEVFRVFESTVWTALLWATVVLGTILLAINKQWAAQLHLPPWIGLLLLAAAFVFALLRASHRRFVVEQEKVGRLSAKVNELEQANKVAKRAHARSIMDRPALVARLGTQPGVIEEISCVGGDPEPCRFADQLAEVLAAAGWTIEHFRPGLVIGGRVPTGVEIEVQDVSRPPAAALALKIILDEAGVAAVTFGGGNPRWPPETLRLKVGHKPID